MPWGAFISQTVFMSRKLLPGIVLDQLGRVKFGVLVEFLLSFIFNAVEIEGIFLHKTKS